MKFDMKFTKKGRELRAKVEGGAELQFTRIAFGDGKLSGAPIEITELQNEVDSREVREVKVEGCLAKLSVMFDNQYMESPFYWREIGVFAVDPDEGEILYSYANSGNEADYIPSKHEMALERDIHLIIMIGNAQNITASIDKSAVYVTMRQLDEELKNYSLISDTGYELNLSINHQTYVLTLQLLNAGGEVLSEKTIDFPIEGMVVDAEYENGIVTLILQNGNTIPVDVSHLISGLVKDTFTIAGIDMKDNITVEELIKALGIDKIPTYEVFQAPNTSGIGAKAGLVPAPTVADIPKVLGGGGAWVPANGHIHDNYSLIDHAHTADDIGALPQNGTAAKTNAFHVPRVLKNPSYSPGVYTAVLEEFQSNCEGLPSNHYYHILTSQGGDHNYEMQLAIGMTVDDMFFRNKKAGAWGNWIKLMHSGNAIPKSGGTFTGAIGVGAKVKLWTDGEGGNIQINSPDSYNKEWQMDAFNGNLRIYQTDKSTNSNYFPFNLTKDTLVANKITASGEITGNLTGNASTATALTTSAGSTDAPVYFSDGKPVRCRCYSPGYGDAFQWWGSGVLTNGNRSIYFTVTLGKPVSENVNAATLQNASMVLRQNGQYLKGSGNTGCTTGFNITLQLKKFNMLTVIITFDTAIGGTNNDCIGVLLEGNLYFT